VPRKVGTAEVVVECAPVRSFAGLVELAKVAGLFLIVFHLPCHTYIDAKPVPKAGQLVLKDF